MGVISGEAVTIMGEEQISDEVKIRFVRTIEYHAEISHTRIDGGAWSRASDSSGISPTAQHSIGLLIAEEFARTARLLYMSSERAGEKLLAAVAEFVRTGQCASNADEDSVCGRTCPVCREK